MPLLPEPAPAPGLAATEAVGVPPPCRVLIAGVGASPRLADGLAVLLNTRLATERRAEVRLADPAEARVELASSPDLLVLGPAADARSWFAAARREAPRAKRILLADGTDSEAARLARRNGAIVVGIAGDGATPIAELAARCAELLADTPKPRGRRGPQPGSRTAEQRRRNADLARALACGELALHYQPCVDLRSARVLGVEALARWPHPAMGNIPPNDFIPVAEASGLILELGAWALNEAMREAASWSNRSLRVSVNVSPRQIEAGVVARQVRHALARTRLDPRRLQIEITEGAVMEPNEATIAALREVRDMGVGVALDDFGTGYASLAAARRLPVTTLKIDRSFVAGLGSDPEDMAIVRAMAEMARSLKLHLVAEGVETNTQRVALLGLGITEGQGWLFGRPSTPAALARHLNG